MSEKRPINWKLVRGLKVIAAVFVATAGGAGLLPKAPGTFGALVGLPIAFFTRDWSLGARLALWGGILAIGTWSAEVFDRTMQSTDNQNIVIDEVLGMGITAWTAPDSWRAWIAAFLLFRLFDIWKPFPIRLLDRWSKNTPGMSGFGVMADDALAGVYGLIVMIILLHFGL
jgi:phosphatidylglycerophosphatase A